MFCPWVNYFQSSDNGTLAFIGGEAFYGCSNLTTIKLPSRHLIEIGSKAFYGCSSLTSLNLPGPEYDWDPSEKSVGNEAFYGCSNLTTINIPKFTQIGDGVFSGCTNLTSVNISKAKEIGKNSFYYCSNLTSITTSNIITIGDAAFYGCTGLTSIDIPNVQTIGESAFYGCSGLTSLTIPEGTQTIGTKAFSYCSKISSIIIPSTVTNLGNSDDYLWDGSNSFEGCDMLNSIIVASENPVYDSRENCNAIIETSTNKLITGCSTTLIPNSVTRINTSAFRNCSGLTSVIIPEGVRTIGGEAFGHCINLTSAKIPQSITCMENGVFFNCSNLSSVIFSVGEIEFWGDADFARCTSLPVIENIRYADTYLCGPVDNKLSTYTIKEDTRYINTGAFTDCDNLTSIYSLATTAPRLGRDAFSQHLSDAILYVPVGSEADYVTKGWAKYFTINPHIHTLNVSSVGYATLYLDAAVEIPKDVEAYVAREVKGNRLILEKVEGILPANTGVIIRAKEGAYTFEKSDGTPTTIDTNLLKGTIQDTQIMEEKGTIYYVLSCVDDIVGMYRAEIKDGSFLNNANKAYLPINENQVGVYDDEVNSETEQLSRKLIFSFDDETSIDRFPYEINDNDTYYNLNGTHIKHPTQKGIYIKNGKKLLVQ